MVTWQSHDNDGNGNHDKQNEKKGNKQCTLTVNKENGVRMNKKATKYAKSRFSHEYANLIQVRKIV